MPAPALLQAGWAQPRGLTVPCCWTSPCSLKHFALGFFPSELGPWPKHSPNWGICCLQGGARPWIPAVSSYRSLFPGKIGVINLFMRTSRVLITDNRRGNFHQWQPPLPGARCWIPLFCLCSWPAPGLCPPPPSPHSLLSLPCTFLGSLAGPTLSPPSCGDEVRQGRGAHRGPCPTQNLILCPIPGDVQTPNPALPAGPGPSGDALPTPGRGDAPQVLPQLPQPHTLCCCRV